MHTTLNSRPGTIEYEDSGGGGPVIVMLHGLLMDSSLWDEVVADLSSDHRCVVPTLPLGAHRHPMRADADLSLPGIARLAAELLDRLDLGNVTLVGNDTGGALVQLLIRQDTALIDRIVLASCDAFDNYPPGLTGKALVLAGKLPPTLFGLFMKQMRLKPLRRSPMAFGWLTMRGDPATVRWLKPIMRQPGIRRDAVNMPCARSRRIPTSCSRPPSACPPSTGPPSSSGHTRTGSCRPSTDTASPGSCHKGAWSRWRTATPSSHWTSPPNWLRTSGNLRTSPTHPHKEVGMHVSVERQKVHFVSGDAECAAWHYPGTNSACVIMAGGLAVTKEPGTDLFLGWPCLPRRGPQLGAGGGDRPLTPRRLKLYYGVHGEGDDFLSEERPEAVDAAISDFLSTQSQP